MDRSIVLQASLEVLLPEYFGNLSLCIVWNSSPPVFFPSTLTVFSPAFFGSSSSSHLWKSFLLHSLTDLHPTLFKSHSSCYLSCLKSFLVCLLSACMFAFLPPYLLASLSLCLLALFSHSLLASLHPSPPNPPSFQPTVRVHCGQGRIVNGSQACYGQFPWQVI